MQAENDKMICPYCSGKMIKGCIEGDSRGSLIWIAADENGEIERFAQEYTILKPGRFIHATRLECVQCLACKKIIISVE